jgi:hypothetical protein
MMFRHRGILPSEYSLFIWFVTHEASILVGMPVRKVLITLVILKVSEDMTYTMKNGVFWDVMPCGSSRKTTFFIVPAV